MPAGNQTPGVRRAMAAWAAAVTAATAVALGAPPAVRSVWRPVDVAIDGRVTEWAELTTFPERLAIAAYNDANALYLVVSTSDAERSRQLLANGLIVWLDVNGGKKTTYGLRVPGSGLMRQGGGPARGGGMGMDDVAAGLPDLSYVELIGPTDKDRVHLELTPESDFAANRRVEAGTVAYEFRMPVASGSSGTPPSAHALLVSRPTLGLGLETPEPARPNGGGGGRGGFSFGGLGGSMGRRGGGRGGPAPETSRLARLDFWTSLELAPPPATSR